MHSFWLDPGDVGRLVRHPLHFRQLHPLQRVRRDCAGLVHYAADSFGHPVDVCRPLMERLATLAAL